MLTYLYKKLKSMQNTETGFLEYFFDAYEIKHYYYIFLDFLNAILRTSNNAFG